MDKSGSSKQTSPSTSKLAVQTTPRRSKPVTPEVTSAQRELRKIEDYWTRHNPVQEDSPRLRSKRKVIFESKECLGHGRKSNNTQEKKVTSVTAGLTNQNEIKSPQVTSVIAGLTNQNEIRDSPVTSVTAGLTNQNEIKGSQVTSVIAGLISQNEIKGSQVTSVTAGLTSQNEIKGSPVTPVTAGLTNQNEIKDSPVTSVTAGLTNQNEIKGSQVTSVTAGLTNQNEIKGSPVTSVTAGLTNQNEIKGSRVTSVTAGLTNQNEIKGSQLITVTAGLTNQNEIKGSPVITSVTAGSTNQNENLGLHEEIDNLPESPIPFKNNIEKSKFQKSKYDFVKSAKILETETPCITASLRNSHHDAVCENNAVTENKSSKKPVLKLKETREVPHVITRRVTRNSPAILTNNISSPSTESDSRHLKSIETKLPAPVTPLQIINKNITYETELETKALIDNENIDCDDNDYIPPRKKLRSQVTHDELWEGIPLTISFKRLGPIQKPTKESHSEKTKNPKEGIQFTQDESQAGLVSATSIPECVEGISETSQKEKLDKVVKATLNDQATTSKTTPLSRKRKRSSTDDSQCKKTYAAKTFDVGNTDHIADETQRQRNISDSKLSHDNDELDKTEEFMSSADDDLMTPEKLLKRSISQILTCGYEVNAHLSNMEIASKDVPVGLDKQIIDFGKQETSKIISKTLENIFDLSNMVTNNTAQIPSTSDKFVKGQAEVKKSSLPSQQSHNNTPRRRSQRLSLLERTKALQQEADDIKRNNKKTTAEVMEKINGDDMIVAETVDIVETVNETAESEGSDNVDAKVDSEVAIGEKDVVNEHNDEKIDSEETAVGMLSCSNTSLESASRQILNMFTKTKNKSKTIPPLRIKLKEPLKCTLKMKGPATNNKSKCTTKCKLKIKVQVPTNNKKESTKEKTKDKSSSAPVKKGSTPTGKLSSKNKSKVRKSSPPLSASMELRLNNERRQAAVSDLLSNTVLNKHACVLWSSENRRYAQLSNPSASHSELDTILSGKWDALCAKEKTRYFQRARDAMKDENRHSTRRLLQQHNSSPSASTSSNQFVTPSVERFRKLAPSSQMLEIKRWLNFYHEIAPEHCIDVMNEFKAQLSEEKQEKERLGKQQKKTSKSKKTKQKQQKQEHDDSDAKHRRMLYEMILNKKDTVIEILKEKRVIKQQFVQDNYHAVVKRLIDGDIIHFSGDVTSCGLSEALSDIRALEKDGKVAVFGNILTDEEFDDLQSRLNIEPLSEKINVEALLEKFEVDSDVIENEAKQVEFIPCLSPRTVSKHLPQSSHDKHNTSQDNLPRHSVKGIRKSPSAVLTEWVAEDILRADSHIEYRSALSLLSNKVVQSPTCIMPKTVKRVIGPTPDDKTTLSSAICSRNSTTSGVGCIGSTISSGAICVGSTTGSVAICSGSNTSQLNSNHSCNVVYTKLSGGPTSTIKIQADVENSKPGIATVLKHKAK